ncbi:MAG: hypothetical protein QOI83_4116, partial [Streptomycetaceae bacterium]|nr:hypothetical protein [Streptomycetaceae bacterium]
MTVDTRGRPLGAALELLSEESVEALTRAIARRTQVFHGAPLKHFPHRAAERPAMSSLLMFRRDLLDQSDKEPARAGFATFDGLLALVRAAQDDGWRADAATGAIRVDEVVDTLGGRAN